MSFIRKLLRFRQQKDITELTDFLSSNETFKQVAKTLHTKTTVVTKSGNGWFSSLDKYLEKELLPGYKKEEDLPIK